MVIITSSHFSNVFCAFGMWIFLGVDMCVCECRCKESKINLGLKLRSVHSSLSSPRQSEQEVLALKSKSLPHDLH